MSARMILLKHGRSCYPTKLPVLRIYLKTLAGNITLPWHTGNRCLHQPSKMSLTSNPSGWGPPCQQADSQTPARCPKTLSCHYPLRDNFRSHRLRVHSYQTVPLANHMLLVSIRCQVTSLQTHKLTCYYRSEVPMTLSLGSINLPGMAHSSEKHFTYYVTTALL